MVLKMSILTYHKVNDADRRLEIIATDNPNHAGAHTQYQISTPLLGDLPAAPKKRLLATIHFQDGNPNEVGVNGITNECLLSILIDRLNGYQAGPYACNENQNALRNCTLALEILHARTRERIHRGVEGQPTP